MARVEVPLLTEVLIEPGGYQLWVTVDGETTHLIDLSPLVDTERGKLLRLPRAWRAVGIATDRRELRWPGLSLPWRELSPLTVHTVPYAERYRPLLPYLRCHTPPLYTVAPMTPLRLQSLLSLKSHQLPVAATELGAPEHLVQQRLYDVGVLLQHYLSPNPTLELLRRPWPIAHRLGSPLMSSMQDCLLRGRPDVVERVLINLILEEL